MKKESAINWAIRAGLEDAANTYLEFLDVSIRSGVKTRRSLWDVFAGRIGFDAATCTSTIGTGDKKFTFKVYKEACKYVGVKSPKGALVAGIEPYSTRTPQVKKWGKELRSATKQGKRK